MGHTRLMAGNLIIISLTVLAFIQLVSWPLAGLLIIAAAVFASLPSNRMFSETETPVATTTPARPPMPALEKRGEKTPPRTEKRSVQSRPAPSQPLEPQPSKPGQTPVKISSGGETQAQARRDAPTTIPEGDYLSFEAGVEEGEELVAEVSASGEVNVYLMTEENLTSLDLGQEFWYDAGSEGVQNATVRFTPDETGTWFLVVENSTDSDVSATVKINVKKVSHAVPLLKTERVGLPDEKLQSKLGL